MSRNFSRHDKETINVHLYLPNLLDQAAIAVGTEFQNIYKKKYGLLRTDWSVLFYLGSCARISAKEICERSNTHKTKISRSVSRLESRGYLIRERSELDRRWEILSLTPSGEALFSDLQKQAQNYEDKLLLRLSADEGKMLRETLQKLIA